MSTLTEPPKPIFYTPIPQQMEFQTINELMTRIIVDTIMHEEHRLMVFFDEL